MGKASEGTQSTQYIIRIKEHLDAPHWETWFGGMTITHSDNGETILSGYVVDQSALHGLLEKIRSLNLTLISVQRVCPGQTSAPLGAGLREASAPMPRHVGDKAS